MDAGARRELEALDTIAPAVGGLPIPAGGEYDRMVVATLDVPDRTMADLVIE